MTDSSFSSWLTAFNQSYKQEGSFSTALLHQGQALLGTRGQGWGGHGWWGMGQINPAAGHIETNARQIQCHIQAAEAVGLDVIVFPELSLMGYPIGDIILRYPD